MSWQSYTEVHFLVSTFGQFHLFVTNLVAYNDLPDVESVVDCCLVAIVKLLSSKLVLP